MFSVTIFDIPKWQYHYLHTFLLTENYGNPMAKNGETTEIVPEELKSNKDSKTVYVNDSCYNLNIMSFDIENIIEKITEEDIE
jgi:hypothetical protein